jgi:aspartyl-tRNA synthetase
MEPVVFNTFTTIRPDRKTNDFPFPKITYKDSMLKYGIDKPDLRNPIEIAEVSEVFAGSDFKVFAGALANDPKITVRAIPAPNTIDQPRSFFDKMVDFAIGEGAKGLGYINFTREGEAKGPVAKFLTPDRLEKLKKLANLKNGDSVFFSCSTPNEAAKLAGKVRIKLGKDLDLINKNEYKFCWIVDFPFFEENEETGKIDFAHNPFSMPQGGIEALKNTKDPYEILAYQYDIVCNGYELASGGVRNHKPETLYCAFEMVGYTKEQVDEKFGGMIRAFTYGAPPHAGCALGIERIIMLLLDEENLREVNAFPTNGKGEDLLMNAPSEVTEAQLRELHIKIRE